MAGMTGTDVGQSTADANAQFFSGHRYHEKLERLDTYRNIRLAVERELRGASRVLDVGNGGVFNYDVSVAGQITAVDLFLNDGPLPHTNCTFRKGSLLDLPFADASFDCVIEQNVLHHVVGASATQNFRNLQAGMAEMARCLAPGGKLVIVESTVGTLFESLERAVFRPALWMKRSGHPMTFQFTAARIMKASPPGVTLQEFTWIPKGRWVLQFGHQWPSVLTPIRIAKIVFSRQDG